MKPIDCKIQNFAAQTGVDQNPVFLWKYGAGRHFQTAYEIEIFRRDKRIYSTGKVTSGEQNNIRLAVDFEEQAEYEFSVRAWDENDVSEVSERASFVTGVRRWRGQWIGNGTDKPFIARKSFFAEGSERAVLSVCVPGQFEVRINGRKVGPYAYEGSQTDFDRHVHYSTYDVSGCVTKGENILEIEAANGWYIGDDGGGERYFYTMDKGYRRFGSELCLTAQLRIGDRYVVTDTSWEVSRSRTVLADVYGSEDIDATVECQWTAAGTATPPKGEPIPADYPPAIRKRCHEPVRIDMERMIFDFGQNMSSQFYLRVRGRRGQKIKLIPAEKLSENGDIEKTTDTYSILTLSGGEDVFEQRFSVNGARWYQIEGGGPLNILEFKSYFVTSSAGDSGSFRCSDSRLNRIYDMILKAIESNLNHMHTDCPTIEKLGWLEPNHLMARSVMYNKDVDTLWSKIAMDMRDSQYAEGEFDLDDGAFPHEYGAGLIPSIAPRYAKFVTDWKEGSFWDIIPWGSSVILAAYEQYLFYGNKRVLADNYESAKRYLEYLTKQYNDYKRLYGREGYFIRAGLGDWGYAQNRGRSRENIETAFYYHDLATMARISEILDKGDEKEFSERAEQVRRRYNQALLTRDESGIFYRGYESGETTQANQAIPLCFGLVPGEDEGEVRKTLIRLCEGRHLDCGEIGLVYILRALAEAGRNDIVFDMLLKDTHPSYLRFVRRGETTLPEFWRDDARSRNHDMMGHVMEWFFAYAAGIRSDDGFRTVSVSPGCTDFLDGFDCRFDSVRGEIRVVCDKNRLEVSLPCNVERKLPRESGANFNVRQGGQMGEK